LYDTHTKMIFSATRYRCTCNITSIIPSYCLQNKKRM